MRELAVCLNLLAWSALACRVSAQTTFDPFPGGSAAQYHFDLARNFFPSGDIELSERRLLTARLKQFEQLSKRALDNPNNLLAAFQTQDSLDLEVNRHVVYLALRYYADTRNTDSQAASEELQSVAATPLASLDSVIVSKPATLFERLEETQPALRRYHFTIENARQTAAHPGPSSATQVQNGGQRFLSMLNETDFGFVKTSAGSLKVGRDYAAIASHPDRRVRREGYLRNQQGLNRNRDAYADILVNTAASLNAAARLRGYTDYAAESYDERYLTREQVTALLESLAGAAEINKRIESAVIDHYRRTFKLDTVHVWDLTAPEPGMTAPRFAITDATSATLEATRPIGESYTRELAKLLDPANGRMDVAPGPNRAKRQGFSSGFVGYPSMFYQGAFTGYVEDVVTLAHESGHAVQNMLMTANGVLPRYAGGPGYFTESFAMFCELLLLRHLYETAPDKAHKIFYLQRLVNQGAGVFRNGWESLLEQQLFDRAGTGTPLTANDIEAMTQSTASRFSVWFGPQSERPLAWLQPTQFFTWPLYRINYVYSSLLALRYFDLFQQNAQQFQERYQALLRNGYDASPDALLRRFVDTGLQDPALINGAVRVLDSWLRELNSLYAS